MKGIAVAAFALVATTPALAGAIGPNDFSAAAVVETFDEFGPIPNSSGSLTANGVTYTFVPSGGYRILQYDPAAHNCAVGGRCLGNNADGDCLFIPLPVLAEKIGGYLGYGTELDRTTIKFFDANFTPDTGYNPIATTTTQSGPFFGFDFGSNAIKYVDIDARSDLLGWTLDNFTYEVAPAPQPVPTPPTLPLFATGLGLMGLFGWRRKRQLSHS